MIHEPQITLIGYAFGQDPKWLTSLHAARQKFPWFTPGVSILFTDHINKERIETLAPDFLSWEVHEIDRIDGEFSMKHTHSYVHTSHLLVFQADGYPVNPAAWNPEFMEVDYIGAKWWYKDGYNVGNGGFCLRTKKLMEILPQYAAVTHPEDEVICRRLGPMLREKHGIKFASEDLADQFSVERMGSYCGQFGFHGDWQFPYVEAWLQTKIKKG